VAQPEPRWRGPLQGHKLLAEKNANSASRAACDLNAPASNPPSSFKRVDHPEARIADRAYAPAGM